MKAVILAAGRGLRMGTLTASLPKVMLPVFDLPLLEYSINYLKQFGIRYFYINTHYRSESIVNYFQNGKKWNVNITYSIEPKLFGTAGALHAFKKHLDQRFVLLYGDVYSRVNISTLEAFHIIKKSSLTMVVHKSSHPADSDLIAMDETDKIISSFFKPHKKIPKTNLSLAALSMLEPDILDDLPDKIPCDFEKDFLRKLLKTKNNIFCYNTSDFIADIGTPSRYQFINDYLSNTASY